MPAVRFGMLYVITEASSWNLNIKLTKVKITHGRNNISRILFHKNAETRKVEKFNFYG